MICAAPVTALAQVWEPAHQPRCSASSTVEYAQCASAALDRADAELNAVYQQTLQRIRRSNEPFVDKAQWETALRAAQRAWIAWRDADCTGLLPFEWGGGTGTNAAITICQYSRTVDRTAELRGRYLSR
jgi:uncharacterized protein YecT (DUF1311 family)